MTNDKMVNFLDLFPLPYREFTQPKAHVICHVSLPPKGVPMQRDGDDVLDGSEHHDLRDPRDEVADRRHHVLSCL